MLEFAPRPALVLAAVAVVTGCGGRWVATGEGDAAVAEVASPDVADTADAPRDEEVAPPPPCPHDGPYDPPTAGDPWVSAQHDAQRTSRSGTRVSHTLAVRWQRDLPGTSDVRTLGLVVDAAGNVYVSTTEGVVSFDRDGALRWSVELPGVGPTGATLVLTDGVLFVGRGFLVARLSVATGEVLAKRDLGGWIIGPAPGVDGSIIAAGMTPGVIALDRELGTIWQSALPGKGTARFPDGVHPSGVTLAKDGSVFVATSSFSDTGCDVAGYLTRYTSKGALLWTRQAGAALAPPSVAAAGTLWVAAPPGDGHPLCPIDRHGLFRFSPAGDEIASTLLDHLVWSSPALTPDEHAVIGTAGELISFTPTGAVAWRTREEVGNGALAMSADGLVVAISYTVAGRASLVEVLDGEVVWCIPDLWARVLAIGPDGTVFAYGGAASTARLTALR